MNSAEQLIERVLSGEARAIARAITTIENHGDGRCRIDEGRVPPDWERANCRHNGCAGSRKVFVGG
jgi:hypothetical protein